ncbi:MAG: hypothetical protein IPG66_11130 [Hydrogenophilales bacterium]|nr:hypothetical protein [Hydrogenophilales bacterium]
MNTSKKTLGIALAASLGAAGAMAADSPFAMKSMDKGYLVAEAGKTAEGKCGAGKCGGNMKSTAKAGEAVCGAGKCSIATMDGNKDGKADKAEFLKHHEAMFAKIDSNKDGKVDSAELAKWQAGACGAAKAKEGKCGEGKCGGMK